MRESPFVRLSNTCFDIGTLIQWRGRKKANDHNDPTQAATTRIRKTIAALAETHPGWSHTHIAQSLSDNEPALIDALLLERRQYIIRDWVANVVGEIRREHRDQLKTSQILAAMSPDGERRLFKLGEMTGYQVVALGERYIASGERLTNLGGWYVEIGKEAGAKKIKTVYTNEQLRAKQEEMGL